MLVGGLVFGLGYGLVGGLVSNLAVALAIGMVFRLVVGLRSMVVVVLVPGLVYGLGLGLVVGLVRGGLAYLQHYCLRFLLYRSRAMPWRYARFLEEATERILLQRVGGGFRFIHPLFQDYFASLGTPAPPPSVQSPLPEKL